MKKVNWGVGYPCGPKKEKKAHEKKEENRRQKREILVRRRKFWMIPPKGMFVEGRGKKGLRGAERVEERSGGGPGVGPRKVLLRAAGAKR